MTDPRQRWVLALCSASNVNFLQLQGDHLWCPHLTSDNTETQRGEGLSHTDQRGTKPGAAPHCLGCAASVLLLAVTSAFLRGHAFTPSRLPGGGGMGHGMKAAKGCGLVVWMKDAPIGEAPRAMVRPPQPWPWVLVLGWETGASSSQ